MAIEFKWPLLGVIIPCVLIAILGYGTHFFVYSKHYTTSEQIWFQVYLSMVWISYLLAIFVGPGNVPPNFEPRKGEWRRWCKKCENYKPERTHHCKKCNTCVLEMDHHCPWTLNCVGHNNMGHFLRFLVWVIFTSGFVTVTLAKRAVQFYEDRNVPSYLIDHSEIVATLVFLPFAAFVCFSIIILFIRFIINVVFKGMTQIEVWESERIEAQFHTERLWTRIRRNYQELHGKSMPELSSWNQNDVDRQCEEREQMHGSVGDIVPANFTPDDLIFPYDHGAWKNLTNIMGYPWEWILPWQTPSSSGFHPEKSGYFEDDQLGLPWPPDGGHQEVGTFENDTNTDVDLSDHRNIALLRKRLDPRSNLQRSEWVNDLGERLHDYGVDLEAEDEEVLIK